MIRGFFFFQAEDGIRYLVRSRGLGDVYKRQRHAGDGLHQPVGSPATGAGVPGGEDHRLVAQHRLCLLYTSDAADERSSVDLGGRRIIKKKKKTKHTSGIGSDDEN